MAHTTAPGQPAAGTAPDRRIGAPDPGSARGEAPAALCPPQPTSPRRAAGPPRKEARPQPDSEHRPRPGEPTRPRSSQTTSDAGAAPARPRPAGRNSRGRPALTTIAAATAILDPRVGAYVTGSGARLAAGPVAMATAASAPCGRQRSARPGASSEGSAEPGAAMSTAGLGTPIRR